MRPRLSPSPKKFPLGFPSLLTTTRSSFIAMRRGTTARRIPEKDRRHVPGQDDQRRRHAGIFRNSRENFSNIVLSVRSLTMVFPFARSPTNDNPRTYRSRQFPKKAGASREELEDEAAKDTLRGIDARAASFVGGIVARGSSGKREGTRTESVLHTHGGEGFTYRERRKKTRISYKALLSGWVAEVAIVL